MNDIWQAFKLLTSHGIGFLRLFDELSPHDLSDEGIEITLAKNYVRLATDLFSPCDSPRVQCEAIALAEEKIGGEADVIFGEGNFYAFVG